VKRLFALIVLILSVAFAVHAKARDDDPIRLISVVPLGKPSLRTVTLVESALKRMYNVRVVEISGAPLPKAAFYEPRRRYRAEKLNSFLRSRPGWKVIGVTDRDISTTAHGVKDYGIMGLGDLGGKVCVVSSFRSHAGVGTVAIHEIGHTLRLPHCPNPQCVMVDAKGTGKIAKSPGRFCDRCKAKIKQRLR